MPASRTGPALVAGGPHGRVLRRAPQDPFLAAYAACSKDAAEVDRPQQKRRQGKKKKKASKKKGREGEGIVRRCGIVWSGWAAGAKYAGAMSCGYGCAVAEQQQGDAPATGAKAETGDDATAGTTLDLSWAPAVLSATALERRREQR